MQAFVCLLKNISFKANKGETVAFIGSTGSGKSTLINLVPRFSDVTPSIFSTKSVPCATLIASFMTLSVFSPLPLSPYLILVALIFAVSGSILSIVAPNKLSKLTDTISSGLVVNQEKFEIIANSINESLTSIDVNSVISSYKLNDLEKQEFLSVMTGSDGKSNEEFISELMGLSENTLGIILPNY